MDLSDFLASRGDAVSAGEPPAELVALTGRWHTRQHIIQWLEDLSAPKSYVKQNPGVPLLRTGRRRRLAQFHIISGFT